MKNDSSAHFAVAAKMNVRRDKGGLHRPFHDDIADPPISQESKRQVPEDVRGIYLRQGGSCKSERSS